MPYTPILNITDVLKSTLHLMEHTEYPHKGRPEIEHVKKALREAIEAIRELEALQADAIERHLRPDPDQLQN
ncbi:MAG TPA: hypothetical protein VFW40_14525 [Capsulimonadaceae bacterium]|nr:hypothetical protein [Capsulimonadaceae bacterium]